MSDTPMEEPRENTALPSKNNHESKIRVFRYMAILFAAAFLLLLLAFLMQNRANQEAISDLTESVTSFHSMENLVDANTALQEENKALMEALEEAKVTAEQNKDELSLAKRRLNALHTLNNIRALYNQGKYQQARDLIDRSTLLEYDLEEYSTNFLSEEGRAIYDPLEAYRNLKDWLN